MKITQAYGMSNEDILSSALIAFGGPTPVQLANAGNGEWMVTGLGIVSAIMKPFTNREVLKMIERAPTVLLMKHTGSDEAFLIKGTVPNITEEVPS